MGTSINNTYAAAALKINGQCSAYGPIKLFKTYCATFNGLNIRSVRFHYNTKSIISNKLYRSCELHAVINNK